MESSTLALLHRARAAKTALQAASPETVNAALLAAANALLADREYILAENEKDVAAARDSVSAVMIDRLTLTERRLADMADGIRQIAALPSPLGRVLKAHDCPNGLHIERVSVPMGVIAMIYESRPNVTSDAAALALKSGNVCVLRGGKEAYRSSAAIVAAIRRALSSVGLPEDAVSLVSDTTRASANELMTARGLVDLLIPRGGAGLIRACVENATVPCLETGTGICHIYIDRAADGEKALSILENAKTSRPSVCNAAEVCLIHRDIAPALLPKIKERLCDARAARGEVPVELRTDESAHALIGGTPATDADFDTEFLDYILAVRVVDTAEEAISHIAAHSTGHSEAIVTEDADTAARFAAAVDSAAVYINASTRFTDGGEFGLGCEVGISTQKMHARGPMGIEELTTYKYIIRGNGQIR